MLSKSNSRSEAGKANQRGSIVGCPYSQDSEVVKSSLAMIDRVGEASASFRGKMSGRKYSSSIFGSSSIREDELCIINGIDVWNISTDAIYFME